MHVYSFCPRYYITILTQKTQNSLFQILDKDRFILVTDLFQDSGHWLGGIQI